MQPLYYENPYLKSFTARVCSCSPADNGRFHITLDQTAFYPEGGGQPSDTGILVWGSSETVPVLEVHEKSGQIVHTTSLPIPEDASVTGQIDWEQRFQNMQLHSGEHLLSGLTHQRYGYDNVGFHMGTREVTIDFNGMLTPEQAAGLEAEANQMIYENLPVEIFYPSADALAQLDYRSKKELTGPIRIVRIPGGDTCACCGTHVARTGEIGILKITGMIKYKGGVRLSLLCGKKALDDYEGRIRRTAAISQLLSAKPDDIVEAVEKLKAESQAKDSRIIQLCQQLFDLKAAALPDSDDPLLLWEDGLSPVQLRQFSTLLYERRKGSVVLVCSGRDGEYHYALGSAVSDMRALSRELNQKLKGRGGGSALMAQGAFFSDKAGIESAFLLSCGRPHESS